MSTDPNEINEIGKKHLYRHQKKHLGSIPCIATAARPINNHQKNFLDPIRDMSTNVTDNTEKSAKSINKLMENIYHLNNLVAQIKVNVQGIETVLPGN